MDGRPAGHQLRFDGSQRGVRCSCFIDHSYIPFVDIDLYLISCVYIMCILIYIYIPYIYIIDIYNKIYVLLCIYDTSSVCMDSLSTV